MTSIFNLFVIIPVINILLLAINFILAPHKPYKEKKTPFECGYHSFLAQNRTQFTISFFLFGILFLLFDIEIVIIYPITVSSYFNAGYGIFVVIIFVLILALGFVFELGKGALKIDTKQNRVHSNFVFLAPFILDAIKQILQSFYDFFTKTFNAYYIYHRLILSVIFNTFIMIASFIICSPYTLNILDYITFFSYLGPIILALYVYAIFVKSDEFNWCYNTIQLCLGLSFILIFWTCIKLCSVCIFESILFFTSPLFTLDYLLKMEGGEQDPSGNTNPSGGTGLPGGSGPPNPFKVITSADSDKTNTENSAEKKPLPKADLLKNRINSNRLGEFNLDHDVNRAVITDRSEDPPVVSPFFDQYFTSSIDTIARESVQQSENFESAKETAKSQIFTRFDIAERREAVIIEKISYAKDISTEDKELFRERAHAQYMGEKSFYTKYASTSFSQRCMSKWTPRSSKLKTNPSSSK